ncbi:site-2 protease family protein, partial [Patescibacteria group bacterium]
QENDQLISINDTAINTKEDSIAYTGEHVGEELVFKVKRNGQTLNLNVKPADDGRVGIRLFNKRTFKNYQLAVYPSDYIASVTQINDVKLPFPQSMGMALSESGRLAVLTVEMFGNVVRSIVTQFSVPEGVAGPVGIASLTHMFVQQGIWSLLRFTALLSLSLAVINIIPFPALDGGRLFFLLIEAVRRKRVPAKWEASIHALGFVLLIGLIFIITYSDILNIFR